MKKIFIIISIFLFFDCFGQKKDSLILNGSNYGFVSSGRWSLSIGNFNDGNSYHIKFFSDSTIEIHGETTKALLLMWNYLSEYQEKYYAAMGVLNRINLRYLKEFFKSKDFSTSVNNHWKVEEKYNHKTPKQ